MKWLFFLITLSPLLSYAQTEDEFLPEISTMVIDSTEHAVQLFNKDMLAHVPPGYQPAFVDREDPMMSKYYFDNRDYESLKMVYQFGVENVMQPDSTFKKSRVVKLVRITGDLNAITGIYNHIFMSTHSPDNVMAISKYDKAVTFRGTPINSTLVSDNYKIGYWTLSFFKLR